MTQESIQVRKCAYSMDDSFPPPILSNIWMQDNLTVNQAGRGSKCRKRRNVNSIGVNGNAFMRTRTNRNVDKQAEQEKL